MVTSKNHILFIHIFQFGNMLESEYESININKEDLIENEPLNKGSNVMENKNTEKNIMESESLSLVECDPDEIISRCSDTNDKGRNSKICIEYTKLPVAAVSYQLKSV